MNGITTTTNTVKIVTRSTLLSYFLFNLNMAIRFTATRLHRQNGNNNNDDKQDDVCIVACPLSSHTHTYTPYSVCVCRRMCLCLALYCTVQLLLGDGKCFCPQIQLHRRNSLTARSTEEVNSDRGHSHPILACGGINGAAPLPNRRSSYCTSKTSRSFGIQLIHYTDFIVWIRIRKSQKKTISANGEYHRTVKQ